MWIYAAYLVHLNMIIHTGGAMSFGTGIIQELNDKRLTDAELVVISEYLS